MDSLETILFADFFDGFHALRNIVMDVPFFALGREAVMGINQNDWLRGNQRKRNKAPKKCQKYFSHLAFLQIGRG